MTQEKGRTDPLRGKLDEVLSHRQMSYADLAERLREIGVEESERSVRMKLSLLTAPPLFLARCLIAIGPDTPTPTKEKSI